MKNHQSNQQPKPTMLQILNRTTRHSPLFKPHQLRSLTQYAKNSQIFIHENPPHHYNFSLSKNPDALTIGSSETTDPKPQTFTTNKKFVDLLHKTFENKIYDDFTFIMEAGTNANSFMPIYDFRDIPKYSRQPYIGNVFGYLQVDGNAKIIPGSWQRNDLYELCNGKDGLCHFSEYMYETLQQECENAN
ncbi:hypothetical protein CORT_0B02680 [Candida orthopsilosis Co 90-125]|uniref:Uncharacterized protein n=1 Tax=Candida orthopsilosis (strain 90-125) TaxID=1136231 RepID=H8X0U4_CANO9|nr:hypothetical protein CORT_0B02680 [Candida orthopsilosis Co 90-125]CCG21983.1 hypothetical protein CORT_0B02680 [Candida orthopsilosis Co 90-125]